jgi:hypothetical protein
VSKRFKDFTDKLKANGYEKEVSDKILEEYLDKEFTMEHNKTIFKSEMEALGFIKKVNKNVWVVK